MKQSKLECKHSRTQFIQTLWEQEQLFKLHKFSNYRIFGFLTVIFHGNDSGGDGELHLISDKPYVFILQYVGGK